MKFECEQGYFRSNGEADPGKLPHELAGKWEQYGEATAEWVAATIVTDKLEDVAESQESFETNLKEIMLRELRFFHDSESRLEEASTKAGDSVKAAEEINPEMACSCSTHQLRSESIAEVTQPKQRLGLLTMISRAVRGPPGPSGGS